jgi:CBS domain-containing protein
VQHEALIVLDNEGCLAGVMTRGDIFRAMDADPQGGSKVLDAASRSVIVTYPDEVLHEATAKMLRNNIGRLPVVERGDPGKVVGYLGRHSVLAARMRQLDAEHVREHGWMKRFSRA